MVRYKNLFKVREADLLKDHCLFVTGRDGQRYLIARKNGELIVQTKERKYCPVAHSWMDAGEALGKFGCYRLEENGQTYTTLEPFRRKNK